MEMLSATNQDVFNEFCNASFTVKRTRNPFFAMGLDQRHEQLNKDVKDKLNIQCNKNSGTIIQHSVDINFVISVILCDVLKKVFSCNETHKIVF